MIAMAVETLIDHYADIERFADIEKEGKAFDCHTFETKYHEALQRLPNSRGSGSAN